jgi:lipopolysaccharide transport system permease protein
MAASFSAEIIQQTTHKRNFMKSLKLLGLKHAIDIVRVLTQKEMKVKYKSSVLGYFWSVGHPLAFALVFFISFKVVMKIQVENYTVFLISA